MSEVYTVTRQDEPSTKPFWIATFLDIEDSSLFVKRYLDIHKYDDCPAGFPKLDISRHMVDRDGLKKRVPLISFYPNAYDCAFVESVWVDKPNIVNLNGGKHVRD